MSLSAAKSRGVALPSHMSNGQRFEQDDPDEKKPLKAFDEAVPASSEGLWLRLTPRCGLRCYYE